MRRSIAIVLATLFSWMLVLPVFSPSAEDYLPACCRRSGKHHCMMHVAEAAASASGSVRAVADKCPYFPHAWGTIHVEFYSPSVGSSVFAGLVHHPGLSPQTEACRRISFHRAHQKRGPPPSLLLA